MLGPNEKHCVQFLARAGSLVSYQELPTPYTAHKFMVAMVRIRIQGRPQASLFRRKLLPRISHHPQDGTVKHRPPRCFRRVHGLAVSRSRRMPAGGMVSA